MYMYIYVCIYICTFDIDDNNSLTCLFLEVIVIFCIPYMIFPIFLLSNGVEDHPKSADIYIYIYLSISMYIYIYLYIYVYIYIYICIFICTYTYIHIPKSAANIRTIFLTGGMSALKPCYPNDDDDDDDNDDED
jgi:hypothetical protein